MNRIVNLKAPTALLVAFALAGQPMATAAPKPLELTWSELSSKIQGRTIELTLPGGTTVGGEVAVVREESLVLNVRKTSDVKDYPKGSATIPRASVTVLSLIETEGKWGRKMGTGLGTLAGVLAGGFIAGTTAPSPGAGLAMFGAVTGAGSLGGYYLGKSADRKTILIRLVP
ncbi:MAG: hypothetical protein ABI833_05750 [Acidobacteriota bacterium]